MGTVALQGRITVGNSNEMRRTLADASRSQPKELTVDLSSVTYMDTSGLTTLRRHALLRVSASTFRD